MAHFLEHMIFMGSNKFPDENLFSKMVSQNGGYTNAYTEYEFTNYYFKIKTSGLLEVTDIKANLLKEPLLKKDAVEREIKSIESEFEATFPSDGNRRYELYSRMSGEGNPMNFFNFGNLKSL